MPDSNFAIWIPVGAIWTGVLQPYCCKTLLIAIDGTITASTALHCEREKARVIFGVGLTAPGGNETGEGRCDVSGANSDSDLMRTD